MELRELLVVVGGLGAIAWVNWYFFFATREAASARPVGIAQEIEIRVQGGYDPGVVRLKRGVPARLVFNRQDSSSCSEEIVLPAFGVRKFLPAFAKTVIELTPKERGTFEMTCGMAMLHGKLIVED